MTGCTYVMSVYLGKGLAKCNTDDNNDTAKVENLSRKVEGAGHKNFAWTIFSPLSIYLMNCRTVRQS
jgi:hypothetical protein